MEESSTTSSPKDLSLTTALDRLVLVDRGTTSMDDSALVEEKEASTRSDQIDFSRFLDWPECQVWVKQFPDGTPQCLWIRLMTREAHRTDSITCPGVFPLLHTLLLDVRGVEKLVLHNTTTNLALARMVRGVAFAIGTHKPFLAAPALAGSC